MKKQVSFSNYINRETGLYTLFGILTSVINIVLFRLLIMTNLDYRFANIITLLAVKFLAYLCNKNFVFYSKCNTKKELFYEFMRFLIARGMTMLIDYLGLILLVEFFHADKFFSKCIVTIFVIIINYFVGKKHVFLNTKANENSK